MHSVRRFASAVVLKAVTRPITHISMLQSRVSVSIKTMGAGHVAFSAPIRAASTQAPKLHDSASSSDGEVPALRMGTPVDEFDLSSPVKDALRDAGFVNLFPVQAATLPSVAAGRDVVVRARTGTGKTLGFLIPMIDFLVKHGAAKRPSRDRKPLALIMTPTRELAIQVEGEFEKVASALALRSVCVYGGTPYVKQASALRSGVDVVVGTPGRITDMINQGYLNLSDIKFAVLDEADDMLRVGFKEDVEQIYESLPTGSVQHMLWSATVPHWIKSITDDFMNKPEFIDLVGDDATKLPETLTHYVIPVKKANWTTAIPNIIAKYASDVDGLTRCLVFTETKREAMDLASGMAESQFGVTPAALTGDLSQASREITMNNFRSGKLKCLIATDVAARGLDIPEVDLVIHVEPPRQIESFVHRSGRTARAGRDGTNVVIVNPSHTQSLDDVRNLETELGIRFNLASVPSHTVSASAVNKALKRSAKLAASTALNLEDELQKGIASMVEQFPPRDLAKIALASLLKLSGHHDTYSIISGEKGHTTLKIPIETDGRQTMDKLYDAASGELFATIQTRDHILADVPAASAQKVLDVMPGARLDEALDHEASELLKLMKRKRSNYGSERNFHRGDRRESFRTDRSDRFDRFDNKKSFDSKGSYRSKRFDDRFSSRGGGSGPGRRDKFEDDFSDKRSGGYGGTRGKSFDSFKKPSRRYDDEFGMDDAPKTKQGAWGRVAHVLDGSDKPSKQPAGNGTSSGGAFKRFL